MRKSIIFAVLAAALAATPAHGSAASAIRLQDNAPDRYVVVKGDTLWSIAAKFLKDPWRWPEMWKLNQEQIKNPHLIYPGDVIVLDRSGRSRNSEIEMGDTVKLSPRIRAEDTSRQAIPSIPPRVIEPFLSRPLVIEPDGLDNAPRIIAAQADRVYLGSGDVAYVSGIKDAKVDSLWQIYRPGKPLVDPESQKTLGYEAVFLGDGKVTKTGDPATIRIFGAQQEIGKGDRLVAAGPLTLNSYAPHAPTAPIQGRIIATRGGLRETGPQNVVTLNKGSSDGLEPGHVLALLRLGRTVEDRTPQPANGSAPTRSRTTKLPDERYGLVFVFRTFDRVSYALVMSASRPVLLDDVVTTPEADSTRRWPGNVRTGGMSRLAPAHVRNAMQHDADLAAWIKLSLVPGLGGQSLRKLLSAFGLPQQVLAAGRSALAGIVSAEIAARILSDLDSAAVDAALEWAAAEGHAVLTLADGDYPQPLLETPDPPALLYLRGRRELLARPGPRRRRQPQRHAARDKQRRTVRARFQLRRPHHRQRPGAGHRRRGAPRRSGRRGLHHCRARHRRRHPLSAAQPRAGRAHRARGTDRQRIPARHAAARRQFSAAQPRHLGPCARLPGGGGGARLGLAHHRAPRRRAGARGVRASRDRSIHRIPRAATR